jgi:hypothetical protein
MPRPAFLCTFTVFRRGHKGVQICAPFPLLLSGQLTSELIPRSLRMSPQGCATLRTLVFCPSEQLMSRLIPRSLRMFPQRCANLRTLYPLFKSGAGGVLQSGAPAGEICMTEGCDYMAEMEPDQDRRVGHKDGPMELGEALKMTPTHQYFSAESWSRTRPLPDSFFLAPYRSWSGSRRVELSGWKRM